MKRILILCFCFPVFSMITSCTKDKDRNEETTTQEYSLSESVRHGEYLINVSGCDDCHTPKKMTEQGPAPDMARRLSGFQSNSELPPAVPAEGWILFAPDLTASIGPWGTTYSANITPHETGIGNWSYEQFKRSFVEGKHKGLEGSRPVLPPMPWQKNHLLKEKDVRAIYDYLQSLPAIDNRVPSALVAER